MQKFKIIPAVIGAIAVALLSILPSRPAAATNNLKPQAPGKEVEAVAILGAQNPTPGSSIFMADVLLGQKLKSLISSHLDRFIDNAASREAVQAYYKSRGYSAIWISNGSPTLRATTVMAVIKSADAEGLDPANYHLPDFAASKGDPQKLAEAELVVTNAVLSYARHAQAGRFGATRVTDEVEVTQVLPDAAQVLKTVAGNAETSAAAAELRSYNPPFAGYRALKEKLAELRAQKDNQAPKSNIPAGPLLRRGMTDPRVPALRERFGLAGNAGDDRYDDRLFGAVRSFQQQKGLIPDGVIGPQTLALINHHGTSRQDKIDSVIANMERWRWLPRNLGQTYVMVDVPDFSLKVVHDRKTVWSTKIIVGKPSTPTPIFSAKIDNIQVNPTWHVPESIIYNEYLPALERDPRVLQRMGLVLTRGPDGKITVQQPPGEENALGQLKFNFPNRFQVYLHDTPAKRLFTSARRAFSHGCMRVKDPAKFGEVLASYALPHEHYTADTFKRAWGGPEQWVKLKNKIPVHIVYLNAYIDAAGKLVIRDDIYGFDKKMTALLKQDPRALANSYSASVAKSTASHIPETKRRALQTIVDQQETIADQRDGLAGFFLQMFR